MKKFMMIGALAGALALVVPGVANAQYGGDNGEIQLSSSTISAGGVLQIQSEAGTWGDGDVNITLFSAPIELGTFTPADDGSLQASVTIPSDVEPGEHTLQLAGTGPDGEPKTIETTLTVAAQGAADEELAATGSSGVGDMLRTSGLVTVVGLTLVALAVSRRRTQAAKETAGV